jgi:hypothetical protein
LTAVSTAWVPKQAKQQKQYSSFPLLLPDLCQSCLRLVQRQLAPDTALPLLLAAREAQVEVLQKAVMAFVARNIKGEGSC